MPWLESVENEVHSAIAELPLRATFSDLANLCPADLLIAWACGACGRPVARLLGCHGLLEPWGHHDQGWRGRRQRAHGLAGVPHGGVGRGHRTRRASRCR